MVDSPAVARPLWFFKSLGRVFFLETDALTPTSRLWCLLIGGMFNRLAVNGGNIIIKTLRNTFLKKDRRCPGKSRQF